ncbi:hypothetical protein D3C72_2446950 [compost metagenome]
MAKRAAVLGHELKGVSLDAAFAAFKRRADQIGEIDDAELASICTAVRHAEGAAHAA